MGKLYLGTREITPIKTVEKTVLSPYKVENGVLSRITSFQGNEFDGIEEIATFQDPNGDTLGALAWAFYLWTISGNLVFKDLIEIPEACFYNSFVMTSIQTASFPKVESINANSFWSAFEMCESLTDIYFNSLKTTSFKSTYALRYMLPDCYNVTIHFPSNLENVVSQLYGYPNFGGDDTVLAFDLPATS